MTTDNKALADVQPGGMVRLVDADPMRSALEDALQFVETLHSTVSGDSRKIVWRCLERGRAALSAKPSPGDQDARVQFDAWLEANSIDTTRWGDGEYTDPAAHNYWWVWQAALAARQPVGEPVVISKDARECLQEIIGNCWRDEDQAVASEIDRLMRGPIYAAPPAQAVDLHRLVPPLWLSEQIGDRFDDLTPGQAWRDGFNECRTRALLLVEQALIDSQAVGNG
ncbi:TPA: hypothetical protein QEL15_002037 [Stenotrophomonas maltophilia]|nr:hypothetical protein [Stenotrophomonas maltophilia]